MNSIAKTAIVSISIRDATIEDFCHIGHPLTIGQYAHIRTHTVIYGPSTIGDFFITGHGVLIRAHCIIGDNVSIGSHSTVEGQVEIGNGTRIHSGVFIPEFTIICEDAWIGPGVIFTNSKHPNTPTSKAEREGVCVGRDAIIGAGAVILPGVVIGKGATVGAGAVVTKDVQPHTTVIGNPAHEIRRS